MISNLSTLHGSEDALLWSARNQLYLPSVYEKTLHMVVRQQMRRWGLKKIENVNFLDYIYELVTKGDGKEQSKSSMLVTNLTFTAEWEAFELPKNMHEKIICLFVLCWGFRKHYSVMIIVCDGGHETSLSNCIKHNEKIINRHINNQRKTCPSL